jgi:phage portal protein BeeE
MGSWLGKFFRRPIAQTIISYTPLTFSTVSADLLGVPAIVRAVNLISTDSARLDLTVTRRDGSVVEDSPAVDLLYGNTASFLSGYEMRKWLATSALYFGNGYLLIRRDLRTGDPVALDPVDPSAVSVEIKGSEARYIVNNSVVDDSSLIHVRASTETCSRTPRATHCYGARVHAYQVGRATQRRRQTRLPGVLRRGNEGIADGCGRCRSFDGRQENGR